MTDPTDPPPPAGRTSLLLAVVCMLIGVFVVLVTAAGVYAPSLSGAAGLALVLIGMVALSWGRES